MNRVKERYVAEGNWIAESALHLGGEGEALVNAADMVLVRDSGGGFLIPGASIAGAARNYAAQGMVTESLGLRALFGGGGTKPANDDYASLLTVRDGKLNNQVRAGIRDGVKICPKSGIAEDGAKYDFEALPKGSSFRLRFELAMLQSLPHEVEPDDMLESFKMVLQGFSTGAIRLGARTRRGLGAGAADKWTMRRLDMSKVEHMRAWLARDLSSVDALPDEWLKVPVPTSRRRFTMDGLFRLKTSLLVRAAPEATASGKQPDSVQLTEGGVQVLPGTSIAGALRPPTASKFARSGA